MTWQDEPVRRQVRIVFGIALVLVGLFATVAGLAIVLLVGPDGSVGIPPTRLLSSGYAVTLPQLNVPRLPGDEHLRLDVTVRSTDATLFVGVGPTPAVNAFLQGVPIDVIEQIDWPGAARTVPVEGKARPARPEAQPFWVVTDHGDAPEVHWEAVPGDWTLVVMNEDARRPVDVTAVGSVTLPALGPIGFILLAIALAVLGGGISLTVRGVRS